MFTRTTIALIAGGTLAVVAGAAYVRIRYREREDEKALSDEDAQFVLFAPGGSQAFWCNGPVGWLTSKMMPIVEAGVYRTVAEMVDLQPDDELLDLGCGPGGFVAAQAQHVRRVVGLDMSPLMMRAAERRLADRIAAGTAELVLGSAASLPFDDGTFSAATAIYAPASPAEVFRVLRPGGRFVVADPEPERKPTKDPTVSYGRRLWGEADYRRMLGDAGFTDLVIRLDRNGLFAGGRKPT